jgi:nucleoid-associated protein YgaU
MARAIVILSLMVAITAAMFLITRKSTVAPGEAANGPSTTVKLADLPKPAAAPQTEPKEPLKEDEAETSLTSAEPRPVTNAPDGAPQSTQDVTQGPVAGAAPSVGTAGIDDKGKASFTGTATPGDTVSLVWDGKPLRKAKADPEGNWAIEFKAPIKKAEHELYVSARAKDGSVVIGPQRATIRPAAIEGGLPRITLKTADETVAAAAREGDVAAGEPTTGLVVEKITLGDAGMTVLTGKADPGATVKAAINGKDAGEVHVAQDGTWTLVAPNLSGKAADRLRLQLIGAEGAKLDEAELPYRVPATAPKVAATETTAKADVPVILPIEPVANSKVAAVKTSPAADDLASAFKHDDAAKAEKPKRKIVRVRRGDSLWRIAKRHLGKGKKWAAFYKLNKRKIDNPDLIYPGQTLIIPG